MEVRLRWAMTPEDLEEPCPCGVCGREFEPKSVLIKLATDWGADMGYACEPCLEAIAPRNPERFPSVKEYQEALSFYTAPMFESAEDLPGFETEEDAEFARTVAAASLL